MYFLYWIYKMYTITVKHIHKITSLKRSIDNMRCCTQDGVCIMYVGKCIKDPRAMLLGIRNVMFVKKALLFALYYSIAIAYNAYRKINWYVKLICKIKMLPPTTNRIYISKIICIKETGIKGIYADKGILTCSIIFCRFLFYIYNIVVTV